MMRIMIRDELSSSSLCALIQFLIIHILCVCEEDTFLHGILSSGIHPFAIYYSVRITFDKIKKWGKRLSWS